MAVALAGGMAHVAQPAPGKLKNGENVEEEHVDFLERQFDMIERMGIRHYVQLNSKAAESS